MSHRGYDEHDQETFDRPRRHTRPRTKERPSYDDAVTARVVTVDRGRYTCMLAGAERAERVEGDGGAAEPDRVVTAMKSRPLGRKGVVVGDEVRLVGDVSGDPGTLARIVEVADRATVLRRTADDDDPVERVVVANADRLVIVTALADPEPRPGFIDRAVAAAYDADIEPLLCLTKSDLASPDDLLRLYLPLGIEWAVTRRDGDLSPLREHLRDRRSVLLGQSGVGKSTLVNALIPGTERSTGVVNAITGRGRHISTSAYALRLPFGGWVIDTPGIRSFGLGHVDPRHLIAAFGDLVELTADCPRACTHGTHEPECGLDDAMAAGRVDRARVDSFRRLLASRETPVTG